MDLEENYCADEAKEEKLVSANEKENYHCVEKYDERQIV